MRKLCIIVSMLAVVFLLCSCSCGGNVHNVKVDLSETKYLSKEELTEAADCIIAKFGHDFDGCELTDIWFDQRASIREVETHPSISHDPSISIMLYSNFTTDENGPENGFNANGYYADWKWILTRDDINGNWRIVSYGYA